MRLRTLQARAGRPHLLAGCAGCAGVRGVAWFKPSPHTLEQNNMLVVNNAEPSNSYRQKYSWQMGIFQKRNAKSEHVFTFLSLIILNTSLWIGEQACRIIFFKKINRSTQRVRISLFILYYVNL
jgi:hypothetical protein